MAFTPWVFLNFSGMIYVFIMRFVPVSSPIFMFGITTLCGAISTLVVIHPYNDIGLIATFVVDVFTKDI